MIFNFSKSILAFLSVFSTMILFSIQLFESFNLLFERVNLLVFS